MDSLLPGEELIHAEADNLLSLNDDFLNKGELLQYDHRA